MALRSARMPQHPSRVRCIARSRAEAPCRCLGFFRSTGCLELASCPWPGCRCAQFVSWPSAHRGWLSRSRLHLPVPCCPVVGCLPFVGALLPAADSGCVRRAGSGSIHRAVVGSGSIHRATKNGFKWPDAEPWLPGWPEAEPSLGGRMETEPGMRRCPKSALALPGRPQPESALPLRLPAPPACSCRPTSSCCRLTGHFAGHSAAPPGPPALWSGPLQNGYGAG